MQYGEFSSKIKTAEIQPIYLISGTESYLIDNIKKALYSRLLPDDGAEAVRSLPADIDLAAAANEICSAPFLTERNVLLIKEWRLLRSRRGTEHEAAADSEELLQLLAGIPEYTSLIIEMAAAPDKRRRLYKQIAKYGWHIEAEPIKPWEIQSWLNQKLREINKKFTREAYEYFLEIVGMMETVSLGFLDQELDKLSLYTDKQLIGGEELRTVMSGLTELSIFSLLDAVCDKNIKQALRLLGEIKTEHPLKILAVLNRYVMNMWQLLYLSRNGQDIKQLAQQCGMKEFMVKKLLPRSRNFTPSVLERALQQIAEADYCLKSGKSDGILLERIIIELCRS